MHLLRQKKLNSISAVVGRAMRCIRSSREISFTSKMAPEEDEADFVSERIQDIAKNAVAQVLEGAVYSDTKCKDWCTQISSLCLKELSKLNKPFKYLVNCILQQKAGAGLCTAAVCYWDVKTDGFCSLQVNGETFDCIVTVYMTQI